MRSFLAAALVMAGMGGFSAPAQANTDWTRCEIGSIRLFQQRFTVYCRNTEKFYSMPTDSGLNVAAAIQGLVDSRNGGRDVRVRYATDFVRAGTEGWDPNRSRPFGCDPENCHRLMAIAY